MRGKLGVLLIAASLLGLAAQATSKYNLSSKRLSTNAVAISCADLADPTIKKIGDILIVTCHVLTPAEENKALP